MSVTLGGTEAQLIHIGRMPHTDDMSVIVFPDQRAVYLVDVATPGRLPFQSYFGGMAATGVSPEELDAWLNSIRLIEMLDVDIVAPGHGFVGSLEDLTEHRHYMEDLRDAVAAGVARGESLDEVQRSATLPQYAHLLNYDAWHAIHVEGMYQMSTQ